MRHVRSPRSWRRSRLATPAFLALALALAPAGARAYVYWDQMDFGADGSTIGDSIWRANLDGHGARNLNPFVNFASSLTLAGRSLFFDSLSTDIPPGIGRLGIDGSRLESAGTGVKGIKPFISGQLIDDSDGTFAGKLASDGTWLYWLGASGEDAFGDPSPVIGRARVDGTQVQPAFIKLPTSRAFTLAVSGGFIYWSGVQLDSDGNPSNTQIGRIAVDGTGGTPDVVTLPDGDAADQIAVNSSHIYWIDENDSTGVTTLARANLDGSSVETNFIKPNGPGQVARDGGLAVDGQHIYFGEIASDNPPIGIVARANLDGSGLTHLHLANNAAVIGVQVDGFDGNQVPIVKARFGHPARCTVPKLLGTRLPTARQRLKQSHCALGTVKFKRGPKSRRGKVVSQSVKAGKRVKAGRRIAVTVGS